MSVILLLQSKQESFKAVNFGELICRLFYCIVSDGRNSAGNTNKSVKTYAPWITATETAGGTNSQRAPPPWNNLSIFDWSHKLNHNKAELLFWLGNIESYAKSFPINPIIKFLEFVG